MSLEQDVGKLVGLVESQAKDIEFIKHHMVGRQEFELRVNEHAEINARIDLLEADKDRLHWPRKLSGLAVTVLVTGIVGAVLTAVFGFNPFDAL